MLIPADGRVRRILHRPGEWVSAGHPLVIIQHPNSLRAVAYIEQRWIPQVGIGSEVSLVSGYALKLPGRVVRVLTGLVNAPDAIATMYPDGTPLLPVEIQLDEVGRRFLIPGSVVRIFPRCNASRPPNRNRVDSVVVQEASYVNRCNRDLPRI